MTTSPALVDQAGADDLPWAIFQRAESKLTELFLRFQDLVKVNPDLNRTLVSFQANRREPELRWVKYREGFSAGLVRYILGRIPMRVGHLLDPFAGAGTTLFVGGELGFETTGIELLPNCAEMIKGRLAIRSEPRSELAERVLRLAEEQPWLANGPRLPLTELAITRGAYPPETKRLIERTLAVRSEIAKADPNLASLLLQALLGILEDVSYTRKDGQYLRWDSRSGRGRGAKPFNKGQIRDLPGALLEKLRIIGTDLLLNDFTAGSVEPRSLHLIEGSCLDILPTLQPDTFDATVTSPPYCNRYDYTRTYALELALLDHDEDSVKRLRQQMLSCTVENKEKKDLRTRVGNDVFSSACCAFENCDALQVGLEYLDACRKTGRLNNPGIVRMVQGYFFEMAVVLALVYQVSKPSAPFVMVNDNVQYEALEFPVDLILSDMAESLGFTTEVIWALPRGKGNSSQQMGRHGRRELRKSVVVWRKAGTNPRAI